MHQALAGAGGQWRNDPFVTQAESGSCRRVGRGLLGSQVREQVAKNSSQEGGGTTHEPNLPPIVHVPLPPLDFTYKFKNSIIKNFKTLIPEY